MKLIGKARFNPGISAHYVDVVICEDFKELQREYLGSPLCRQVAECRAFTEFRALKPGMFKFGRMVFAWDDCEIPIVVHECVHAASYFAVTVAHKAAKAMKRSERFEYFEELMPCLVENLVSETWVMISKEKNTRL